RRMGLAWADVSCGRFVLAEVEGDAALHAELARLQPAEVLASEADVHDPVLVALPGFRRRPPWHFDATSGERSLCVFFGTRDLDRILSRVALRSARPRDLATLRDGLLRLPGIAALLSPLDSPRLAALARELDGHDTSAARLAAAIVPAPPAVLRDGGVIGAGF